MKFFSSTFILLAVTLLITACGSLPQKSKSSNEYNYPIVVLPIATAVQVDYQDEVKILLLNQLIVENKGSKRELAQLFYERGLIYDRMGLNAHSRYDFAQSINADPSFPDAYNSLGIYLLLSQSYDEAFDAFYSAIELSDKVQYSYLHRAIGLYQVKRYLLASRDINKFYEMDKTDPYRTLWRYIIDSKIDEKKALITLQNQQPASGDNHYIWSLIDVIAGRMSEKQFFAGLGRNVNSNKKMAERLCEAYFYLAHQHKLAGDLDKAIYYFRLTTTTNIHEFIEYKYALIELASIHKELQQRRKNTVN